MERHDVKVKIISQKGTCVLEHKEGDEWIFGATSPAGLCMAAFTALAPFIRTLQYGGEYEWPMGSGTLKMCCPDPFNPVIFEITKIPGTAFNIKPQSSWL